MSNGHRRIHNLAEHPESYVRTSELAEYWMVSRKQIYKQIEAGTLKAIRLGPRLLRVSTQEAIEFERLAKMTPATHGHRPASDVTRDQGARPAAAAMRNGHEASAGVVRPKPRTLEPAQPVVQTDRARRVADIKPGPRTRRR